MLDDLNPTTRKYPRTLDEAFPNDAESAKWLHTEESKPSIWLEIASVVAIIAWVLFLYYLVCLLEMKGT
jgi:hypothetical protein